MGSANPLFITHLLFIRPTIRLIFVLSKNYCSLRSSNTFRSNFSKFHRIFSNFMKYNRFTFLQIFCSSRIFKHWPVCTPACSSTAATRTPAPRPDSELLPTFTVRDTVRARVPPALRRVCRGSRPGARERSAAPVAASRGAYSKSRSSTRTATSSGPVRKDGSDERAGAMFRRDHRVPRGLVSLADARAKELLHYLRV
jgi:hypothetical protein